jgi:hypothetical protein
VDPLNKSEAEDCAALFEDATQGQDTPPAYVSPTVEAEEEDGGLFRIGIFDGASDRHDQASFGGDGPHDGYDGYWSYHPYPRNPNSHSGSQTYGPQPGYVAPHPPTAFPPQAGPPPTGPGKRVHFEMGGPPNTGVEASAPHIPFQAPVVDHSVHGHGQQGGYPVYTHPVPFDAIPLYAGPQMPGPQIPDTQIPAAHMPGPHMPGYGGQSGWGGQGYMPYPMHPGYGHGYGAVSGVGYYPAGAYQGQGYGQGTGTTVQGMATTQNGYMSTNTNAPAENKKNQDNTWQDQNNTSSTSGETGGDGNWASKDASGSNSGGGDNWANSTSNNNDTPSGNDDWNSGSNNTSGGIDGWNSDTNNNTSGGNDGWGNEASNDTNNTAANDNTWGDNNDSTWADDKKNETSESTNNENTNGIKWGETITTSNPPQDDNSWANKDTGSNDQPNQSWGANDNTNQNQYQTQNQQFNEWGLKKDNTTANGFAAWTPAPPIQSMPGSFPQARTLYGPHGPYYLPHPSSTPHTLPPTVEEEPRYDVPVSYIAATNSTHQVVPGRGYVYSHRVATPVYMDTVSNPYARFVFKYRNEQQLAAEVGVNVNGQPTGEEMTEYATKSKEEVIEMLLCAKAALGGQIPEPIKPADKAEKKVEPIIVPAPVRKLKDYSIPMRAASQSRPSAQTLAGSVLATPSWGNGNNYTNMNPTQHQQFSGAGAGWQGAGSGNGNVTGSTYNGPQNTNANANTGGAAGWGASDQTQTQTRTWGAGMGGGYGDPGPRPVSEAGSPTPQNQSQNGGASGEGQDWGATSGATGGGAQEATGSNW